MITPSSAYSTENATAQRTPIYRVVFDGISQHYSTAYIGGVSNCSPVMQTPRNFSAQVIPERGQSSISQLTFVLNDVDGEITQLVMNGIEGKSARIDAGFADIDEADYVEGIFHGIVDSIRLTNDLVGYEITLRAPQSLTNRQIFDVSKSELTVQLTSGVTTELHIRDASGFIAPGFVRIDDEFIFYTGKTHVGRLSRTTQNKIAYGNGKFVALDIDADGFLEISLSVNGLDWTDYVGPDLGGSAVVAEVDFCSASGLYVVTIISGSANILTSPDGITWTARYTSGTQSFFGLAFNGLIGVAVGSTSGSADRVITTADGGLNWTDRGSPFGANHGWKSVVCAPQLASSGRWIAVSATNRSTGNPTVMTSDDDGVTWTTRTAAEANDWQSVDWSGTVAVAVSSAGLGSNRIQVASDGVTWFAISDGGGNNNTWEQVIWASRLGLFVAVASAVGSGAYVMTSPDGGASWTQQLVGDQVGTWRGVAYASDLELLVALGGVLGSNKMHSPNAVLWTLQQSKLTTLTRTEAVTHTVGSGVAEILVRSGHPCDLILDFLQNTDKTGVAIDADLIDVTGIDVDLRAAIGADYQMEFVISAAANLKQFLETEFFQPLGLYPVTRDGKYSIHQMTVPTASVSSITHDTIVAKDGKPDLEFDSNFRQSIINKVIYEFDADDLTGEFTTTVTYQDDASIDRYGEYPVIIRARGLHTDLAGTDDLIETTAQTILARYKHGAPVVKLRTFLSHHLLEPGDIVAVSSSLIPNPMTNSRGIENLFMEALTRGMAFDAGQVELTLSWPAWRGLQLPFRNFEDDPRRPRRRRPPIPIEDKCLIP